MSLVLKQARAVFYWPPRAQTLQDDELVHIRGIHRTQALVMQSHTGTSLLVGPRDTGVTHAPVCT